jgi:hypothetical protein
MVLNTRRNAQQHSLLRRIAGLGGMLEDDIKPILIKVYALVSGPSPPTSIKVVFFLLYLGMVKLGVFSMYFGPHS